jgi:acyl-CoA synthetase (NDP forming)
MMNAHAALVRMSAAFARADSTVAAAVPVEGFDGVGGSELDAKRVLARLGIALPREAVCANAAQAARFAAEIGCPVAIKIVSPDIAHKTEAGGVVLDVKGSAQVVDAVHAMEERVRSRRPDARLEGYLVSEMAPHGTDCLVGVRNDPAIGPVVLFGAGGIMAEWLEDVSVRLAPVTVEVAREMVEETKVIKLLRGWRGSPPGDIDALAQAISAISSCITSSGAVRDFEVNPLRVLPQGRGVLALDALIVGSADTTGSAA